MRVRKVSHLLDKVFEKVIHKALMETDPPSIRHTLQELQALHAEMTDRN